MCIHILLACTGTHKDEGIHNNPFFYLWIVSLIVSTCYATTWDLKMDWGLLEQNSGENRFLREEMVYGSKVIAMDLF